MNTDTNKATAQRWLEEGFNAHNPDGFDDYFAPDVVNHALPPDMPNGAEGTKMFAGMFFNAFPDIVLTFEHVVAQGDRLALHWSATGTHRGDLMGIPPTGREVQLQGVAIDRFENGRSVEHWEIMDQLGLMVQLGVVPAPGEG